MRLHHQNSGFTLVELIIVIVILSILGASVVVRFTDFGTSARSSAVTSLEGSIRSATAIAHSIAIIEGKALAGTETVNLDGTDVTLTYGYPAASSAGIAEALASYAGFTGALESGNYIFTKDDAPNSAASCKITYTAATGSDTVPTITAITACT